MSNVVVGSFAASAEMAVGLPVPVVPRPSLPEDLLAVVGHAEEVRSVDGYARQSDTALVYIDRQQQAQLALVCELVLHW